MRGDVEHRPVVVKAVLGAVPVVEVEIDDEYAAEAVFLFQVPGPDGNVVENAETHRPSRLRVMSRRPDEREAVVDMTLTWRRR